MLTAVLKKEVLYGKIACRLFMAGVFVSLITLGAFVRIPLPFTPVPLTLQTFFVLLSAVTMGRGWGVLVQVFYLALGISGVSVFAYTGSGMLYLAGPTGGYLFGFLPAVLFVGGLSKRAEKSFILLAGLLTLGGMFILLTGTLWLKLLTGSTFRAAFLIGFVPFAIVEAVKAVLAASVYMKLRHRMREILG